MDGYILVVNLVRVLHEISIVIEILTSRILSLTLVVFVGYLKLAVSPHVIKYTLSFTVHWTQRGE